VISWPISSRVLDIYGRPPILLFFFFRSLLLFPCLDVSFSRLLFPSAARKPPACPAGHGQQGDKSIFREILVAGFPPSLRDLSGSPFFPFFPACLPAQRKWVVFLSRPFFGPLQSLVECHLLIFQPSPLSVSFCPFARTRLSRPWPTTIFFEFSFFFGEQTLWPSPMSFQPLRRWTISLPPLLLLLL